MTEISEAAKLKACELINDGLTRGHIAYEAALVRWESWPVGLAFARYIQQVSDAAKACVKSNAVDKAEHWLSPFILPDPVDPLAVIIKAAFRDAYGHADQRSLERLTAALARRGLKIVEAE